MKTDGAILEKFAPLPGFLSVREVDFRAPGPGEIAVEMLAAPINPADLNIIEGAYGDLPELPDVIGNEGAGRVVAVGEDVSEISEGDLVAVLRRGTWVRRAVFPAADVFRLPPSVEPFQAAMLAVNPPTALLMLERFVELSDGDWVVQNAANSAVGRSVIQIAKARGLRTLNIVRREELFPELRALGADIVVTEETDLRKKARELTGGAPVRLALNAVGGQSALNIANALTQGGTHITYGGMAKQPLKVPNGLLIFKDLAFRGFWLTRWKTTASASEQASVFGKLSDLLADGRLSLPVHAIYPLAEIPKAIAEATSERRTGKVLIDLQN
jgi:mitochondrial enoyl-[acyl-carrier protein] reductase / trans-2-enoyl-CoA reductase